MNNRPWMHSRVSLTWMSELGTWTVTDRDGKGWVEITPENTPGINLARLGSDGTLWVRTRDLTRQPDQLQELPI